MSAISSRHLCVNNWAHVASGQTAQIGHNGSRHASHIVFCRSRQLILAERYKPTQNKLFPLGQRDHKVHFTTLTATQTFFVQYTQALCFYVMWHLFRWCKICRVYAFLYAGNFSILCNPTILIFGGRKLAITVAKWWPFEMPPGRRMSISISSTSMCKLASKREIDGFTVLQLGMHGWV